MFNRILRRLSSHGYLLLCWALSFIVVLSGCGTPLNRDPASSLSTISANIGGASIKGFEFSRIPSEAAAPNAFKYERNGADFAADLPYLNIQVSSQACQFNPEIAKNNSLAETSYCIYRMRCYQAAETAVLDFEWAAIPAEGTCWVGLPDWQRGCWQWQLLPEANRIELVPSMSANEFHQVFAAVVLLGGGSASLGSIKMHCEPDGMVEYTLFAPISGYGTFLLDMEKQITKRWVSSYRPNSSCYLLENGHMLRTCSLLGGTYRGRLEEYDWDLNLVWYFEDFPAEYTAHHDIAPMPNGNILVVVEQTIAADEAIQAGVDTDQFMGELRIDAILEIEPLPENTGQIVWVWRAFDHLIQDFDETKANYGFVGEHPELLDINYDTTGGSDFSHANSVAYNPKLDQVIINFRSQSEFYILDHSTTTEEAASHSGGRYGRGGDFLYRWGNPEAYRQGTSADRQLFYQHDSRWIADGCPGAGNILVFNNGEEESGPGTANSTLVELVPPLMPDGTYAYDGGAYGPAAPVWEYVANPPSSFYCVAMGGAQRLPSGNTLICNAMQGVLFEVTPAGATVWVYTNPYPFETGVNGVFKAERYYLFGPDFPVE